MLAITFDEAGLIVTLEPDGVLTVDDFSSAKRIIDEHLALKGELQGIIIRSEHFPGWRSFQAFSAHLKFVKDHHRWVKHVALVTDSPLATLAETLAKHFISAEIKQFPFNDADEARRWILNDK